MSLVRVNEGHYRLDLRGMMCPYPKMMTEALLKKDRTVETLELLTDCPSAIDDVPKTVLKIGYETISTTMIKDGEWKMVIQKGDKKRTV
jgi:tRNA 2-thiouridine synthesizing protein A